MQPVAIFVFMIFMALVAIAIIVPQIEKRRKGQRNP
jgi:hypothetical protein